jgi:hypothetical protein
VIESGKVVARFDAVDFERRIIKESSRTLHRDGAPARSSLSATKL